MEENRKTLKVYHGIIMLILSAVCVFFVSPILGANLGLYGTLLNEILLLVLAVALTAVVRGDFKQVFPIHKPKLSAVFGTILLWIGSFLAIMIITMIIAYFFPEEVIGVSQGLGMEFASLTFIISFVIVSISPAICEEAVFRGVVMHSFDNGKNKWIAIVVTGLIFGAFHGNIWRFVPTALLGIMLGYIVYETDNMIYGALFHAINNAMPLLSIFAMKSMYSNEMFQSQMSTMTDNGIPLIDWNVCDVRSCYSTFTHNRKLSDSQRDKTCKKQPVCERRTDETGRTALDIRGIFGCRLFYHHFLLTI